MHTKLSMKHARRLFAALCALTLAGSLAACGSSSSDSGDDAATDSSSALSNLTQIAGVTITSEVGSKPELSFNTPLTVADNSYVVLQDGDGDVIEADDRVCAQAVFVNVKDGSELGSTWEDNTPDCSLDLTSSDVNDAYKELVVGRKLNTTLAIGVNDSNSSGTSYLSVLTLVSTSKDYDRATGQAVADIPADLPKVTLDDTGKPSVDMNGYKGSDELIVQPLIQGSGAEVQESGTVKAHYTGWLLDGTQFDSSWDSGAPIDFPLSNVIQGWQQGLAGQKVGSQVLLVIPPDLGYGDQESGSIPANSTLVFVVDILATY